jgi:hypothetical protein
MRRRQSLNVHYSIFSGATAIITRVHDRIHSLKGRLALQHGGNRYDCRARNRARPVGQDRHRDFNITIS